MSKNFSWPPHKEDFLGKDIRQAKQSKAVWGCISLDKINIDLIRQFREYIIWQNQVYLLKEKFQNIHIPTNRKFINQFREEIEICERKWGKFKE